MKLGVRSSLLVQMRRYFSSGNTSVPLFTPYQIGDLKMKNRIVMAALTRQRANVNDGIPTEQFAKYYSARAGAALINTESIPVSIEANAYLGAGCLYNDKQEQGWKNVVERVHQKNGIIFAQLFHGGRGCISKEIGGLTPVSSSAVPLGPKYKHPDNPREATLEDIQRIRGDFTQAAKRAKRAGFDGIELHCANGYLPDQFLRDSCNKRTDQYGGSVENKARFTLELLDDILKVYPSTRVGIKVGLRNTFLDMEDSDPEAMLQYLIQQLNQRNVAFLECKEGVRDNAGSVLDEPNPFKNKYKKTFKGTWIANSGYDYNAANIDIAAGNTDMVSFGNLFVFNDDLVERFASGKPVNVFANIKDKSKTKFYMQSNASGDLGYTDLSVYEP